MKSAAVAAQRFAFTVKCKRGITARADSHITTVAAENIGGFAASIDVENGLLFALERFGQGILQRITEDAGVAVVKFLTHVDDFNGWQINRHGIVGAGGIITGIYTGAFGLFQNTDAMSHDARRQNERTEFAFACPINGFEFRRGAAEDQGAVIVAHHLFGDIAGMVIRWA